MSCGDVRIYAMGWHAAPRPASGMRLCASMLTVIAVRRMLYQGMMADARHGMLWHDVMLAGRLSTAADSLSATTAARGQDARKLRWAGPIAHLKPFFRTDKDTGSTCADARAGRARAAIHQPAERPRQAAKSSRSTGARSAARSAPRRRPARRTRRIPACSAAPTAACESPAPLR